MGSMTEWAMRLSLITYADNHTIWLFATFCFSVLLHWVSQLDTYHNVGPIHHKDWHNEHKLQPGPRKKYYQNRISNTIIAFSRQSWYFFLLLDFRITNLIVSQQKKNLFIFVKYQDGWDRFQDLRLHFVYFVSCAVTGHWNIFSLQWQKGKHHQRVFDGWTTA